MLIDGLRARACAGLVVVIAAVASGVTGCDKALRSNELLASLPLEVRELVGITIALPEGELVEKTVSYRNGEIQLAKKQGRRLVVILSWQVGEPLSGDELATITDAVARNMRRGDQWTTKIGEYQVHGVHYSDAKAAAVFGTFACGNRSLFLAVVGQGQAGELRTLHDRIAISTRCVDDEAAASRWVAPVFSPPPGFGYAAADSSPDSIMFAGLDGSTFAFFHGGAEGMLDKPKELGEVYGKALAAVVPGLELSAKVEHVTAADGSRRLMWPLRVAPADSPASSGVMIAWMCTSIGTNLIGLYLSEHADTVEAGKQAVLTAGCPGKDDDPVAGYPTAEVVFQAACDAGDERGCFAEPPAP